MAELPELPESLFRSSFHFGRTKPFLKWLASKPFQKRLEQKSQVHLGLRILSPNPIGVINRRNGCGTTLSKRLDRKLQQQRGRHDQTAGATVAGQGS